MTDTEKALVTRLTSVAYALRQKEPDSVKFRIDRPTMETVANLVDRNNYKQMIYLFGYRFVTGLLAHFESTEEFERCGAIVRAIELHNQTVNDNIPTR